MMRRFPFGFLSWTPCFWLSGARFPLGLPLSACCCRFRRLREKCQGCTQFTAEPKHPKSENRGKEWALVVEGPRFRLLQLQGGGTKRSNRNRIVMVLVIVTLPWTMCQNKGNISHVHRQWKRRWTYWFYPSTGQKNITHDKHRQLVFFASKTKTKNWTNSAFFKTFK